MAMFYVLVVLLLCRGIEGVYWVIDRRRVRRARRALLAPASDEDVTAIPARVREELAGLSLRARMALAVACFERALRQLGTVTPQMATLLEVLWRFPTAHDLSWWEADLKYAAAPGLAWRHTVEGADDVIWEGLDPRLRHLYEELEEIGIDYFYGSTSSDTTVAPLFQLIEATKALGITPPDPALLAAFTPTVHPGLGRPIPNATQLLTP